MVERGLQTGMIEIAPLAFMRGRTLAKAAILLDEAQNATAMQMKMFLTRLGEGSRMMVNGDPSQIDLAPGQTSGLAQAVNLLAGLDRVGHVRFAAWRRRAPRSGAPDRRSLRECARRSRRRGPDDGPARRIRRNRAALAPRRCRRASSRAAAVAAAAAEARVTLARGAELTIHLADDEGLRALNKRWRGKDAPTNVLSFPAVAADRLAERAPARRRVRRLGDAGARGGGGAQAARRPFPPSRRARLPASRRLRPRDGRKRRRSWRGWRCGRWRASASPTPTPARSCSFERRSLRRSLFERLRGLLGLQPGSVRDDIEEALDDADGGADFTAKERTILKNVLSLHDVRVADVMAPRADVVALPLGRDRRRGAGDLPHRRPFAPAGVSRDARRPPRHGPHPRLPRLPRLRSRLRPHRRRTSPAIARARFDMSTPLAADLAGAAAAVRAAVDAGARSAGAHAGLAHPYRAGHRRIWRHRRPGVDGGHRRDDRRRHRGRARRGRGRADLAGRRTASSSSRRARRSRRWRRRSASTSSISRKPPTSTPSAAW